LARSIVTLQAADGLCRIAMSLSRPTRNNNVIAS